MKILEAFAARVPVVCTHAAVEGLDAHDGEELAIADHAQDFADRVLGLLEAPARAIAMAGRARRFVEERHSWSQIASELENEYREALRRKGLLG